MNTKLITFMLALALFVVTALPVHGEELMTGKFFLKNIVINGEEITNYNLINPFILFNDTTYMPMTATLGEICGFSSEFNSIDKILKLYESNIIKSNLSEQTPHNNVKDAVVIPIPDAVVLKMEGSNKPFDSGSIIKPDSVAMILVNGIPYLPLRALIGEYGFGWDLYYDPYFGICISTKDGVPAKTFFSSEQANHSRALQSYILSKNKNLPPTLALDYVFLFKRAAKINNLDVKLLLAIAQQESNFNSDAVSSAGARGIMQIMPKTGEAIGLTPNQLFDPKLSILYGAAYFKENLSRFDNNLGMALSAYAMGGGAVSRGGYSRGYVEKIYNNTSKIETYLNNQSN